jgi:hypothetical protein
MNARGGEAMGAPGDAASTPTTTAPAALADRLVFFFSGFDPKGAGYYHRLYRQGAAARSALGDAHIAVGRREPAGPVATACDLEWLEAGTAAPVRSRFHYMRWDDIVRRHWSRSPLQLARDYFNVYAIGLTHGDFARIRRKSRAAWGMAIFPLVVAILSLSIVFPAVFALSRHLSLLPVPALASALIAAVSAVAAWRLVVRRIDCEWLLRLYAFTRAQALGELPQLEARMDAMADDIVRRVGERLDAADNARLREVLLVGYSTGSTVAASVLARALPRLEARFARTASPPALSMLTLGHCLPIAADWAEADHVREELRLVGACESLTWHDWSARADWAAFWRTPPWPEGSRLQGVQRSPRFHAQLSEDAYAALKRDRRQMHLQYLRPPTVAVQPSGYDWFRLTAGPEPLAASAPASPADLR